MHSDSSIQLAANAMGLELRNNDRSGWMNQLAEKVNDLLVHDFNKLVMLLYRIDISEKKLKTLLKAHPDEDAGKIIAAMIIERQAEKIKSRQQFNKKNDNIDEEEKW